MALSVLSAAAVTLGAQNFPSHEIKNGEITARVYLPDAKSGFYKSTRFDWSGAIAQPRIQGTPVLRQLVLEGHRYLRLRVRAERRRDLGGIHRDGRTGRGVRCGRLQRREAGRIVRQARRRRPAPRRRHRLQPLEAVRDRERREVGRQARQRLDRVRAHAHRAVTRLRLRLHEGHPAHEGQAADDDRARAEEHRQEAHRHQRVRPQLHDAGPSAARTRLRDFRSRFNCSARSAARGRVGRRRQEGAAGQPAAPRHRPQRRGRRR